MVASDGMDFPLPSAAIEHTLQNVNVQGKFCGCGNYEGCGVRSGKTMELADVGGWSPRFASAGDPGPRAGAKRFWGNG